MNTEPPRKPSNAPLLPIGAHVTTPRAGYIHHGIYVGDGRVVHYAGYSSGFRVGPIEEVSLAEFADGHAVSWRERTSRFSAEEIVRRARSRLGEDRYKLLANNCEHFCAWCIEGNSKSEQVEHWLARPRDWLTTLFRWLGREEALNVREPLYSTIPIDRPNRRYSTVTLFARLRG